MTRIFKNIQTQLPWIGLSRCLYEADIIDYLNCGVIYGEIFGMTLEIRKPCNYEDSRIHERTSVPGWEYPMVKM